MSRKIHHTVGILYLLSMLLMVVSLVLFVRYLISVDEKICLEVTILLPNGEIIEGIADSYYCNTDGTMKIEIEGVTYVTVPSNVIIKETKVA